MKINKTKLLFIATLLFLALPLILTPGNAGAVDIKSDGARLNANGGWDLPTDLGSCPNAVALGDSSQFSRNSCAAIVFPNYTDSTACSSAPDSTWRSVCSIAAGDQTACEAAGGTWWDTSTLDATGGGTSCTNGLYGMDGTEESCTAVGGTFATACGSAFHAGAVDVTYPGYSAGYSTASTDQCLRCHNNITQYNRNAIRWKQDYVLTGHKNMLRKVAGTGGTTNLGGPDWTSTNSDARFGYADVAGAVPYADDLSSAYYVYGGWYRNKVEAKLERVAASPESPRTVTTGDYTCGDCHATGWNTAGVTLLQPDNGAPGITNNWAYDGVQCDRCHNLNSNAEFDDTWPNSHHGPVAEDDESTELCFHCHEQSGVEPFQVLVSPSATDMTAFSNFTGHYRSNQFLNSPHARFEGTHGEVVGGTYESHFGALAGGANGGCVRCHDVHISAVDPDVLDPNSTMSNIKSAATCGTTCHSYIDLSKTNHPMGPGTPLDGNLGTAKGKMFACTTCHMGPGTVHLFRINTDPNYSPFVSGQNVAATYVEEAGSTYPAVGMSLDLACGQCHGGSEATTSAGGASFRVGTACHTG